MKKRIIAFYMSVLALFSSSNLTKPKAYHTNSLSNQSQISFQTTKGNQDNIILKLQNPFLTPTFSLFSNLKKWERNQKVETEMINQKGDAEMKTITIGSFNTKDNQINRKGGIREDGTSNAEILAKQIKEYDFDYLGTQELTVHYVSNLMAQLENYKCYGNYRCGNLLSHMPYNENNMIVTKQNVEKAKTVMLPWVADNIKDLNTSITKMSIMPRIATIVITKDEQGRETCMINTHLDYQVPSIQIRQLEKLKELICKYQAKYPIIVTGDFNMEPTDPNFQQFITDNQDIIQHVDIQEPTWHGENGETKTLDHIFVPADWDIIESGIIDSMGTSDHNMVFAKVKRK